MKQSNSAVWIVAVPPGEAPLWAREKWVGLELPLARYPTRTDFFVFGVLSTPRTWLARMWAVARGRAERVSGYAVGAVDVLERSNPEAAAWWREHAPQYVAPGRYLVFREHTCQVIDV